MKTAMKLFITAVILLFTANLYSLSDGAFNMTGAPGTGDCTGCHNMQAANSDPKGSIEITIDSSSGFYEPGKIYPVKVTVAYSGKNRFGFALNTRQGNSSMFVGTFLADANSGVFNRAEFVAHRRSGIDASNKKTWEFKWQAPDTGNQDITFYAAGVVSNSDNSNTGDLVFTTNKVLKRLTTGTSDLIPENSFQVYPIPSNNIISISNRNELINPEFKLYNLKGEIVQYFSDSQIENNFDIISLSPNKELSEGIYLLEISSETKNIFRKIILTR